MNHAIDESPIGEATQIAVVDEQIGLQLAGIVAMRQFLFRIIAVDGIEFQPTAAAELDGIGEQIGVDGRQYDDPRRARQTAPERSGQELYPGLRGLGRR